MRSPDRSPSTACQSYIPNTTKFNQTRALQHFNYFSEFSESRFPILCWENNRNKLISFFPLSKPLQV
jgi:hypothetical protein